MNPPDMELIAFDFKPPATAPEVCIIMGGFGKRLFEPSDVIGEFPIAAP